MDFVSLKGFEDLSTIQNHLKEVIASKIEVYIFQAKRPEKRKKVKKKKNLLGDKEGTRKITMIVTENRSEWKASERQGLNQPGRKSRFTLLGNCFKSLYRI